MTYSNSIQSQLKSCSASNPTHRLIDFVAFLRSEGFNISVDKTLMLIQALQSYGIESANKVKNISQTILCSEKDQWQKFDEYFQRFFFKAKKTTLKVTPVDKTNRPKNNFSKHNPPITINHWNRHSQTFNLQQAIPSLHAQIEDLLDNHASSCRGSSTSRQRRHSDFTHILDDQLIKQLGKMSHNLNNQLTKYPNHRLQKKGNQQIDYPSTLAKAIKNGGEILPIEQLKFILKPPPLLIFIDISASMSQAALSCISTVWALCQVFESTRVFLLDTEIYPITRAIKKESLRRSLESIKLAINGWGTGTSLANCLEQYQHKYYKKNEKGAYCLFFSDGLDTGDEKKLYATLHQLNKQNRKLVWINPNHSINTPIPQSKHLKYIFPLINQYVATPNLHQLDRLIK